MKIASLPLLVLLLGPTARAAPPSLAHAVAAFNNFQDAKAAAELKALIRFRPATEDAAKAHLYLGLIALNALDSNAARTEFKAALAIEPTLEVPYEASPKARLVFNQAQKEFTEESGRAAAPPAQPARPGPTVPLVVESPPPAQAAPAPRSKLPGIVLAALAVATLGVGVGFGVAQTQTLNVHDANQIDAAQSQAATQGLVADVCFGVGGGLGVAALVVLITELTGGTAQPSALRVVPAPGGAAAAVAF